MFSRRSSWARPVPPGVVGSLVAASLAAALAISGCAGGGAAGGALSSEGLKVEEGSMSSLALIDEALRTGQIDYSTGLLFKVYAVFDPMSLPPEYESAVPIGSGSLVVAEVQRNWHRISPDHRAEISQYIPPVGDDRDAGTDTDLDDIPRPRDDHDRHGID